MRWPHIRTPSPGGSAACRQPGHRRTRQRPDGPQHTRQLRAAPLSSLGPSSGSLRATLFSRGPPAEGAATRPEGLPGDLRPSFHFNGGLALLRTGTGLEVAEQCHTGTSCSHHLAAIGPLGFGEGTAPVRACGHPRDCSGLPQARAQDPAWPLPPAPAPLLATGGAQVQAVLTLFIEINQATAWERKEWGFLRWGSPPAARLDQILSQGQQGLLLPSGHLSDHSEAEKRGQAAQEGGPGRGAPAPPGWWAPESHLPLRRCELAGTGPAAQRGLDAQQSLPGPLLDPCGGGVSPPLRTPEGAHERACKPPPGFIAENAS